MVVEPGPGASPQWRGFPDPLKGAEPELEKENQQLDLDRTPQPNITVGSWAELAGIVSGTRATHYRYKSFHATTGNFLEGGRFFPAVPNPSGQDRPNPGTGAWRIYFYRKEGPEGEHTTQVPLRAPGGAPLDVVVSMGANPIAPAIQPRSAGGPQEFGGVLPSSITSAGHGVPSQLLGLFEAQSRLLSHYAAAAGAAMREREELGAKWIADVEKRLENEAKKRKKLTKKLRRAEANAGGIAGVIGGILQDNPEIVIGIVTALAQRMPTQRRQGPVVDDDQDGSS
jgi:hypothetical protein